MNRRTDIVDFLPDPTWVIDAEGRVIARNRAVEQVTGIDQQAIIGQGGDAYAVPFYGERRPMLIDLALKRDPRWEKNYLRLKEDEGILIASESFHPAMGGGGRYFASTAFRLFDAHGHVVGAIESIRDITAEKRLQEEREQLIAELQNAIAKVRTLSGLLPSDPPARRFATTKATGTRSNPTSWTIPTLKSATACLRSAPGHYTPTCIAMTRGGLLEKRCEAAYAVRVV